MRSVVKRLIKKREQPRERRDAHPGKRKKLQKKKKRGIGSYRNILRDYYCVRWAMKVKRRQKTTGRWLLRDWTGARPAVTNFPSFIPYCHAMPCTACCPPLSDSSKSMTWIDDFHSFSFFCFLFVPQVPNIFDQKEKKYTKKRKRKSNWNMMFSPHYVRRLYSTFVLYNQEAANCPRILIWLCVCCASPGRPFSFFVFLFHSSFPLDCLVRDYTTNSTSDHLRNGTVRTVMREEFHFEKDFDFKKMIPSALHFQD